VWWLKGALTMHPIYSPLENQMSKDTLNVAQALTELLKGRTEPFRYDLKKLQKVTSNTPYRKIFGLVADALTFSEVVNTTGVGHWCVAEVEGCDVQFNPVIYDPELDGPDASVEAEKDSW
jgi:hypothetical protein